MPAEPMDEWEFSNLRMHLRDAKPRIARGQPVDPLTLIKIAERALQEVERLNAERSRTLDEFAQAILQAYDRRYQEWTAENGVKRDTPRTLFHQIIEEMLSSSEPQSR